MNAQRLHPNRRIEIFAVLLLLLHAGPASALSSDRQQEIMVEADSAELDESRNVSIYRGNVVVEQGSIRMTGDEMTVYNTKDEEIEKLILTGRPATYRQLPDSSTVYDEARATRMEYYEIRDLIILINNAVVSQERLRFSGDRIEYDTARSQVRAWSKPKDESAAAEGDDPGTGERVKIIIKKKPRDEAGTP